MRTLFRIPAAIAVAATMAASVANADPHDTAVVQALDKVTARVSTLEIPVGLSVRFGTLEIVARHCDKRPPEDTPESAAFLDIWESRLNEPATSIFRGWMFASSPAVSALEHPVYDVWVIDCKNNGVVINGEDATADPSTSEPTESEQPGSDQAVE